MSPPRIRLHALRRSAVSKFFEDAPGRGEPSWVATFTRRKVRNEPARADRLNDGAGWVGEGGTTARWRLCAGSRPGPAPRSATDSTPSRPWCARRRRTIVGAEGRRHLPMSLELSGDGFLAGWGHRETGTTDRIAPARGCLPRRRITPAASNTFRSNG
jgi:hypothetical protein